MSTDKASTKHFFRDYSGEEQPLTLGYMHEMLDRLHCLMNNLQNHLLDHPAAVLAEEDIQTAVDFLSNAYQKVGRHMHELEEE